MKKLSKTQKIITLFVIATAVSFLLWGCETDVKSEVKTDSTLTDSVLIDSVKVDTIGKD